MPLNTTTQIPAATMTPLSAGAVEAARVQCVGAEPFWLIATAAGSAPSGPAGGLLLYRHPGLLIDAGQPLAELFPGLGAAVYLWGWAEAPTAASVMHG